MISHFVYPAVKIKLWRQTHPKQVTETAENCGIKGGVLPIYCVYVGPEREDNQERERERALVLTLLPTRFKLCAYMYARVGREKYGRGKKTKVGRNIELKRQR